MSLKVNRIADSLFNANCLRFGTFKIKSGALSPYYIDIARLLSSPKDLSTVAKAAAASIQQIMNNDQIDKIASIALKGALIAPSIASLLNLPCIIIRKSEKNYGAKGRVVGAPVVKNDHILFFDDVVSEGLSKVEGIKPLKNQGACIKHLLVVVDREQGGKETLEQNGYILHSLAKISEIVKVLSASNKISDNQAHAVLDYIQKMRH